MLSNILQLVSSIISPVANMVDNLTTTDAEKGDIKNKLETIKNSMASAMLSYEAKLTEAKAEIVKSETVGSWLQRSWRPIIMLMFGFIIMYEYFISNVFNLPKANLPGAFWELLNIGLGGYIVGRSAEKIAPNFKKN